nr:hypothetical protein [Tanacetum cinerariifolium]
AGIHRVALKGGLVGVVRDALVVVKEDGTGGLARAHPHKEALAGRQQGGVGVREAIAGAVAVDVGAVAAHVLAGALYYVYGPVRPLQGGGSGGWHHPALVEGRVVVRGRGQATLVIAKHVGEGRGEARRGAGVVGLGEHGRKAGRGQVGHGGVAHRGTVVAVAQALGVGGRGRVKAAIDVALHRYGTYHHTQAAAELQGRAGGVAQQRQGLAVGQQVAVGGQAQLLGHTGGLGQGEVRVVEKVEVAH